LPSVRSNIATLSAVFAVCLGAQHHQLTQRGAMQSRKQPRALLEQARKAEAKHDLVRAYQLYSQAAAEDPTDPVIWGKLRFLRNSIPSASARVTLSGPPPPVEAPGMAGGSISAKELEEARLLTDPIKLSAAKPGRQNFHLKGDVKKLWEDVAAAFGLLVIFERDLANQPPPSVPIRLDIDDADYRSAFYAVASATNTFPTAITDRVALVSQDNVQKRTEYEQTVVRVFPIPDRTSIQEAQEISQAIQQTLEMRRIAVDQQKRQILVRDRLAKVELAAMLLLELSQSKPQVEIEMELLSANKNTSRNWGIALPNSAALVNFGKVADNVKFGIPTGFLNFLTFGGGATFLGLGIGNAQLLADYTKSESKTILRASLTTSDGQAGTLHIGDKYPIITSQYSAGAGSDPAFNPPPVINFEELGLVLKVTPFVHGIDEATLELEAEFKVLGAGGFNGIPVINTRKFQSKLRLTTREWAVVAGLVSRNDTRTLTGIAGLADIPVLGPALSRNGRGEELSDVLVLLKPRIVSMPASERVTNLFWYGSENRPRAPI
jgi:general secretion pathway protein D